MESEFKKCGMLDQRAQYQLHCYLEGKLHVLSHPLPVLCKMGGSHRGWHQPVGKDSVNIIKKAYKRLFNMNVCCQTYSLNRLSICPEGGAPNHEFDDCY